MTVTSLPATSTRTGSWTPAILALLSGTTDVTSWILLGGLFTAHITGNVVVLAANLVTGTQPRLAAVLALPVFIGAVAGATWIARLRGSTRERTRALLLGGQAAFLCAAAVLSFTTIASADPDAPLAVLIGMCAVTAMALQNAYLHLDAAPAPSTGVMTGNLVVAVIAAFDLVTSRASSTSARSRWSASWRLLAGFVVGCLLGSGASLALGDHAAIVPAAIAVVAFVAIALRRGTPAAG